MSRVLITGSNDGLGLAAAQLLAQQGHVVVLHGRNSRRSDIAMKKIPTASGIVTGDFSKLTEVRTVAAQADKRGPFDAVIHNAGIGFQEPSRGTTVEPPTAGKQ